MKCLWHLSRPDTPWVLIFQFWKLFFWLSLVLLNCITRSWVRTPDVQKWSSSNLEYPTHFRSKERSCSSAFYCIIPLCLKLVSLFEKKKKTVMLSSCWGNASVRHAMHHIENFVSHIILWEKSNLVWEVLWQGRTAHRPCTRGSGGKGSCRSSCRCHNQDPPPPELQSCGSRACKGERLRKFSKQQILKRNFAHYHKMCSRPEILVTWIKP